MVMYPDMVQVYLKGYNNKDITFQAFHNKFRSVNPQIILVGIYNILDLIAYHKM